MPPLRDVGHPEDVPGTAKSGVAGPMTGMAQGAARARPTKHVPTIWRYGAALRPAPPDRRSVQSPAATSVSARSYVFGALSDTLQPNDPDVASRVANVTT